MEGGENVGGADVVKFSKAVSVVIATDPGVGVVIATDAVVGVVIVTVDGMGVVTIKDEELDVVIATDADETRAVRLSLKSLKVSLKLLLTPSGALKSLKLPRRPRVALSSSLDITWTGFATKSSSAVVESIILK